MICLHAKLTPENCDGGIPARKIVCLIGMSNTCLMDCSKCTEYTPKVQSYQRTIHPPQPVSVSKDIKVQNTRIVTPNAQRLPVSELLDASRKIFSERLASLPKGRCSGCGAGNSNAMR